MTRRRLLSGIGASVAVTAMAIGGSASGQSNGAAPAAVATPRTPDGKPDLSGVWGNSDGGNRPVLNVDERGSTSQELAARRCGPNQVRCGDYTNQSEDGEFTARMNTNRPLYKPEYWDKVQQLDMWTNKYDPIFICQPLGIPRAGAPSRIIQTATDIVFFYGALALNVPSGRAATEAAGGYDYRIIPTDGRKHDPVKSQDVYFWGHSVGRWEGDTLVIDSIAFNDLTWFDRGGYFHSDKMRAIERFRREGNTLHYEVTIEDPEVLAQPWVLNPRQMRLNTDPNAGLLPEATPCRDYDHDNMVTQIRH
jgi:hypothetical protein